MDENTKIMLVDDEPDFLEIMGKFFSRRKMAFETATGCLGALDLLAKGYFDVVIMDISMPGLNGFECMAEMKKVQPEMEIIFLTGHASLNTGIDCMKKGAFDYCLKPIDFSELFEKIILARRTMARKEF